MTFRSARTRSREHPPTPRGCVEETTVAPAGRERVTPAAGVKVLPVIARGWQIYFVARYMLDA